MCCICAPISINFFGFTKRICWNAFFQFDLAPTTPHTDHIRKKKIVLLCETCCIGILKSRHTRECGIHLYHTRLAKDNKIYNIGLVDKAQPSTVYYQYEYTTKCYDRKGMHTGPGQKNCEVCAKLIANLMYCVYTHIFIFWTKQHRKRMQWLRTTRHILHTHYIHRREHIIILHLNQFLSVINDLAYSRINFIYGVCLGFICFQIARKRYKQSCTDTHSYCVSVQG